MDSINNMDNLNNMVDQVIAYDKTSGKVKIIDGRVTIPLYLARKKGFTPANLIHMAVQLLEVEDPKDPHNIKARQLAKKAIQECLKVHPKK